MPSLIGTLPDQLPTNGDLGELAFQNKDSVEFYDGRGGLQHLVLTAIKRNINVSATDVFVYDTSKDSDGGAWRNRTQHTSWYNETLNTATRGSRREFPSVAVIVATTTSVTIYDGDDPVMPMWMMFNQGGSWPNNNIIGQTGSGSLTSVVALNGTVSVSLSGDSFRAINFISELTKFWWGAYYREYKGFIVSRNSSSGWTDTASPYASIPSSAANDIAMTVLANAPIDASTGLPIPTIAVATAGGVSVIIDNGAVVNSGGGYPVESLSFNKNGTRLAQSVAVSTWDTIVSSDFLTSGFTGYTAADYSQSASGWSKHLIIGNTEDNAKAVTFSENELNLGFNNGNKLGLFKIAENLIAPALGMQCVINTKSNTGWMPGDIKGAWLSDTTQETITGSNVFPNPGFSGASGTTPPTGWNSTGATYSVAGGVLSVTCGANNNSVFNIDVSGLIVGRQYTLSLDVQSGDTYWRVIVQNGLVDTVRTISSSTRTTQVYTVFAQSSSINIYGLFGNGGTSGSITNVSLRLSDPNRSINNNGLEVFGNITKTPVATGADLVAYSGFSSSNYLHQPYNSSLNFGSGDFCAMGWARSDSTNASTQGILFRGGGGERGFQIMRTTSAGVTYVNSLLVRVTSPTDDIATWNGIVGTTMDAGVWNQIILLRRSGFVFAYFNGVQVYSAYNPGTLDPYGTPSLSFGINNTTTNEMSLAMWRISATAPSVDQIRKMYEDEKYLFQDNAKATLYGTSNAVTALAYDEDTNLLHVGTSSGRSVFNGLRRVDNTTDAVGACISAAGGLVAED